ncbi:MAG: hypothetical protein KC776_33200 [Myxococcales bacterium]|nr:hypothetical protein [Myxococcales bacterium]MCB9579564.1 hypothetical protein [Polyangiaceae bacterium]
MGLLEMHVRDGIAAVSEATFPENDFGAPDWRSTEMVRRTEEYLDELPPGQRRLLLTLFLFVELFGPLLTATVSRLSNMDAEERTLLVRGFRRSGFFPFRVLGESLKAITTMMYMSHPSVQAYIGEYRSCERPLDPAHIEFRPDALPAMEAEG